MKALAIVLILTLSACGSWHHPTATSAQLKQDELACDYEAAKAVAGSSLRDGARSAMKAEVHTLCLKSKGYEYQL